MEQYKIDAIKELLLAMPEDEAVDAATEITNAVYCRHKKLGLIGSISSGEQLLGTVHALISGQGALEQLGLATALLLHLPHACLDALVQLAPDLPQDKQAAIAAEYQKIPAILQRVDGVFGEDWQPGSEDHPAKAFANHLFSLSGVEAIEALTAATQRRLHNQIDLQVYLYNLLSDPSLETATLLNLAHVAIGDLRRRHFRAGDQEAAAELALMEDQIFRMRQKPSHENSGDTPPTAVGESPDR